MAKAWKRLTAVLVVALVPCPVVWGQQEPQSALPPPANAHLQLPVQNGGPPQGGSMPPTHNGLPPHGAFLPPTQSLYPFDPSNTYPTAFTETCPPCPETHCYFSVGALALQRSRLGHGVIAVLDPGTGTPGQTDHGNLPPPGAEPVVFFDTVPSDFHWGVQARTGIQCGPHGIEFYGFWMADQEDLGIVTRESGLDLPFAAFPPPLGFEGNNFLWLQADRVAVQLAMQLGSAEVNYRHRWNPCWEFLAGVRYVDTRETFSIITDDDAVVAQPSDPFRIATYQTEAQSRIFGPQIGFAVEHYLIPQVALSFESKGMVGYNIFEVDNRLFRGDGFQRTPGHRNGHTYTGVAELGLNADLWFNTNVRVRIGYQALWLIGLPVAHQQVDFNPADIIGTVNDDGTIFYHGPRFEFGISF